MIRLTKEFRLIAILLPVFLVGCSGLAPYVHNPNEFNRNAPNFGKEPADMAQVAVCYNGSTTTPQDVLALAESTCRKFGKTAKFERQDIMQCPLLTPARAHFSCVPADK